MSLYAVGEAIDGGHEGTGWVPSKDPAMLNVLLPTACKKCMTPWPCATIVRARSRLNSDTLVS